MVVVNTHLYATSLAIQEAELLPAHDLVVFDEAHELEDIASAALGFDLNQARLVALARLARPLVADASVVAALEDGAVVLGGALRPHRDQALSRPLPEEVSDALVVVRERVNRALEELRKAGAWRSAAAPGAEAGAADDGPQARRSRAQKAAAHLLEDVNEILELPASQIAWVEGPEHGPVLRVAPIDVGEVLLERLWKREDAPTAVMTSATIPPRLGQRLGLPAGSYDELNVGSPFCYPDQALAVLPGAPARPPGRPFRGGHARRTGGSDRGLPGPGAGAVHQLAGHAGGGGGGARAGAVDGVHPVGPA